jgi:ion channel
VRRNVYYPSMKRCRLGHLLKVAIDRFKKRRHSSLLVALIVAFAVRPLIGAGPVGFVAFSAAILILAIIGLYNINVDDLTGERDHLLVQNRRRQRIGWLLVATAFGERVAVAYWHTQVVDLTGSIGWFALMAFVTWHMLRGVLKQKSVTSETISMSISVYLLLAFTWGLLYAVIFLLQPGAFSIPGLQPPTPGHPADPQPLFPILGYFSLITLSTVGYGDITPLTLQARLAAAAEGITGQFYLAILVARLVSMQMNQTSNQPPTQNP